MVASAVAVGAMQFAKKCSVVQSRGVGVDAHDIEVLPIGGAVDGSGGGLHAGGAGSVPVHAVVSHKITSPAGGINAVAEVGGKSSGGEVGIKNE